VRGCIAFDNNQRGFVDGNGSHNCRYFNCVAYRNNRAGGVANWGFLFESRAGRPEAPGVTIGATFKNCVSYLHAPSPDITSGCPPSYHSVLESDYDLIGDGQTCAAICNISTWDQHSFGGNPQFISLDPVCDTNLWVGNPALRIPNPQFGIVDGLRLGPSSPCIDHGTNIGQSEAPVDGNGDGTAQYDIGPYEFVP
jgi:hypothetical protein